MPRTYQQPGLTLAQGAAQSALVKALQADLRVLGYLRGGVDGAFGPGTAQAVQALQYDLMNNGGASSSGDGSAPVAPKSYNKGRVTAVTGAMDQNLAACLDDMMSDASFAKLPSAPDPRTANAQALQAVASCDSKVAPAAFVLAITKQESGWAHYRVPSGPNDSDSCVTVGLDRNNAAAPYAVTSRGYGLGQYTLFHHPPTAAEMAKFIADPVGNVAMVFTLLEAKLESHVIGPGDTADDRMAEFPGKAPLRLCKYPSSDPRYFNDCQACAQAAGTVSIRPGRPVFSGAALTWATTQYYSTASYDGVPDRAKFPCDWPYAVRRYNGGGINSYHYQARVLTNLLTVPAPAPVA
ncbi:MAG TPA: peptidoglycan-binding domain-containing protein [Azospirillaceae bacterium]|nr:peptidoglycan-binding domain-containing protein [Azospirillaceae bacterium]